MRKFFLGNPRQAFLFLYGGNEVSPLSLCLCLSLPRPLTSWLTVVTAAQTPLRTEVRLRAARTGRILIWRFVVEEGEERREVKW